jgi:hypothetical protein
VSPSAALQAQQALVRQGYRVRAQPSRLAHLGYELAGESSEGDWRVYAWSYADMLALCRGGKVARVR